MFQIVNYQCYRETQTCSFLRLFVECAMLHYIKSQKPLLIEVSVRVAHLHRLRIFMYF